jgi:hypothetical protein
LAVFGRFLAVFSHPPTQGRITFNPIPEIAETLRIPGEPAASTLTVGGDGGSATVATAEGHGAAGRKTHLAMPFYAKLDQFSKTGLGQT